MHQSHQVNVAKLNHLRKEVEANKKLLRKMEITPKPLRQVVGHATSVNCSNGLLPRRFDAEAQTVTTRGVLNAE